MIPLPITTTILPSTLYQCLRCGHWTRLDTPCCCAPLLEEPNGVFDLPSFVAGGLCFLVLWSVINVLWWLWH